MQYDENGYPIKGNNSSQNHSSYGAAPTAAAASSSAAAATAYSQNASPYQQQASPYQTRQESPLYDENGHPIKPQPRIPQQQREQQHSGAQQSGPRYDERGYPIKQQQQQQQVSGNGQPAYAQQGAGSPNQNRNYPTQPGPGSPEFAYNNNAVYTDHNQSPGPMMSSYQPYGQPLPQHNYWTTGLCDMCADCDVCMEGCCCMCCQEGRIYEAAANDTPNTMSICACCISCWCFYFPFINLYNRRKVIEKYNIQEEGCCISLFFSWFCPCLSVCQMQRELQARGLYPGGQCCAPSRDPKGPSGQSPMGVRGYGQQNI